MIGGTIAAVRRALDARNELYYEHARLPSGPCYCHFLLAMRKADSLRNPSKAIFQATHSMPMSIRTPITATDRYWCALTRETLHAPALNQQTYLPAYFAKVFRPDNHLPISCLTSTTTAVKGLRVAHEAVATRPARSAHVCWLRRTSPKPHSPHLPHFLDTLCGHLQQLTGHRGSSLTNVGGHE